MDSLQEKLQEHTTGVEWRECGENVRGVVKKVVNERNGRQSEKERNKERKKERKGRGGKNYKRNYYTQGPCARTLERDK